MNKAVTLLLSIFAAAFPARKSKFEEIRKKKKMEKEDKEKEIVLLVFSINVDSLIHHKNSKDSCVCVYIDQIICFFSLTYRRVDKTMYIFIILKSVFTFI